MTTRGSRRNVDDGIVLAIAENQRNEVRTSTYAPGLPTSGGKPGRGYAAIVAFNANQDPVTSSTATPTLGAKSPSVGVAVGAVVRRLTPLERERLMGWPDDHTRWAADGREMTLTARDRMTGNGVVTPVARWVAGRVGAALQEVDRAEAV